jgi:hypothetical protein
MTNNLKRAVKVAAIAVFLIDAYTRLASATPSVPQKTAGGSVDLSTSWAKRFDKTVRNVKHRPPTIIGFGGRTTTDDDQTEWSKS